LFASLTYSTPKQFAAAFEEFYANINVKHVKLLSLTLLALTCSTRVISLIYFEQSLAIKSYHEHSLVNYVEIVGFLIFSILGTSALKPNNWKLRNKKILALSFVIFILLVSLATSYIASSYNTKNTLTMFLMGILAASLFFILEYKEIIAAAIVIGIVFFISMVFPKISFEDKLFNIIVGILLGFFLVSLSRFNYYYQSQNFVKIKELEDKNIKIQQLNKEKKDILNFVAHDLRNPLNNIEALSNLMLLTDDNEEAKMIASSAKQAKEIINDLLVGVKPNLDPSETARIELSESLTGIIEKWVINTKRKIHFVKNSSESYSNINPSKLERVIDNLISNSIKFSESSQPINITLTNSSSEIHLKIQDFGIGIPKELLENIFDQFSQSGRTGLQGEKSTGLGLHISKKIIEEHQGTLLISSEENKGTTFNIRLPLA
jgi:signal transduction histidine kinase